MVARSEGSFMAAATAGGAMELGSTICTHASWAGSAGGSFTSAGGSFSASGGLMGRSFVARQVRLWCVGGVGLWWNATVSGAWVVVDVSWPGYMCVGGVRVLLPVGNWL
jgi:hypothetical protein